MKNLLLSLFFTLPMLAAELTPAAVSKVAANNFLASLDPVKRDPAKYYVAIFGTPGDPKGWGWRLEGHHVSINLTLVDGKYVSVTPSFLGSNPGEVRQGAKNGLRVLAAEEDLARPLATTLLAAGKTEVIFSDKAPAEILSFENRKATALDPVGVLSSDLTGTQRSALLTLISEYTGRDRPEIAATDMAKIKAAGLEKIRFGWAGGAKPGDAYYYCIQGPIFLMEAANTRTTPTTSTPLGAISPATSAATSSASTSAGSTEPA
jgi:hypothetical protein